MGRSWLLVSCFLATACTQDRPAATGVSGDLKLDFGMVQVGGTFPRDIVVQNPTQKDGILTILDVSPPFSTPNHSIQIRANGSVTLRFFYQPSALGQDRLLARLVLPGSELRLLLAGTAGPPPVVCGPETGLDFGAVLAAQDKTLNFTCINSSEQEVDLTVQTSESLGRDGMFEPNNPTLSIPGRSFSGGTVTLHPMFEGDVLGYLTLSDSAGGMHLSLKLTARVVPSWLEVTPYADSFTPLTLAFDTVPVGKSASARMHLKNIGSIPIDLGAMGDIVQIGPFGLSFPSRLQPGQEADVTVTFTPSENGLRQAVFNLWTSDHGTDVLEIDAQGYGGGPALSCDTDSLDYGQWELHQDRVATLHCQSVGIDDPDTNLDDLRVTAVTTTGDFFPQGPTLPLAVPGGHSFDVPVAFHPNQAGSRFGELHVVSSAGEVVVNLSGQAVDTTGCDPLLQPGVGVDFRRVQPGTRATLDAWVENHGTGPCLVRDVAVSSGSDNFSVQAPDSALVEPGDSLLLPVTVNAGAKPVRLTGQLTLWLQQSRALPLTATVQGGCLSVSPSPLDLGRAPTGCQSLPMVLTLHNDCGQAPVRVTAIDLAGGSAPAFVVVSKPDLPLDLPGNGSATMTVAYIATRPGADAGGVLFTGDSDDPLLAPLQGVGLPAGAPVERFDTSASSDVLVVVDDNPTSPVGGGITDFADTLVQELDDRRISYHLGVTGTSLVACDLAANLTPDGRLLPVGAKTKIVTNTTPLASDVFASNLQAASCSAVDNGLEAAYRALHLPLTSSLDDPRHPEMNDGSLGFLREGAELSLVFLVASDDTSSHDPDYYDSHMIDVAPVRHVTVAGGPDGGCQSVDPAGKYHDFADRTGGAFTSVCGDGWGKTAARKVASVIGKQRSTFPLARTPPDANGDGIIDEQDISVAIDGVVVPHADTAAGTIWMYAPDSTSGGTVVFAPGQYPPLGAVVGINYGVICNL